MLHVCWGGGALVPSRHGSTLTLSQLVDSDRLPLDAMHSQDVPPERQSSAHSPVTWVCDQRRHRGGQLLAAGGAVAS